MTALIRAKHAAHKAVDLAVTAFEALSSHDAAKSVAAGIIPHPSPFVVTSAFLSNAASSLRRISDYTDPNIGLESSKKRAVSCADDADDADVMMAQSTPDSSRDEEKEDQPCTHQSKKQNTAVSEVNSQLHLSSRGGVPLPADYERASASSSSSAHTSSAMVDSDIRPVSYYIARRDANIAAAKLASSCSASSPLGVVSTIVHGGDIQLIRPSLPTSSSLYPDWPRLYHTHDSFFGSLAILSLRGEIATFKVTNRGTAAVPIYCREKDADLNARTLTIGAMVQRTAREIALLASKQQRVTYLVDAELTPSMHDHLLATHPVARCYAPYGLYGAMQYFSAGIRSALKDDGLSLFPRMKLFVSPATHGRISTGAHTDGDGLVTSIHIVAPCSSMIGANRIATWTNKQIGIDHDEMTPLRYPPIIQAAFNINATGGSVSKKGGEYFSADVVAELNNQLGVGQSSSRSSSASSSSSTSPAPAAAPAGRSSTSRSSSASSSSSSSSILPATVTILRPCYSVVQPPGLMHAYSKVLRRVDDDESTDVFNGGEHTEAESAGGFVVGLAGEDWHIGRNEVEAIAHLRILSSRQQLIAASNLVDSPPSPLNVMRVDLPLFLIMIMTRMWPDMLVFDGVINAGHWSAAQPLIESAIDEDERSYALIAAQLLQMSKKSYLKDGGIGMHDPNKQTGTINSRSVTSAGVMPVCRCSTCGINIFHLFYYRNVPSPSTEQCKLAIDDRYCGRCVLADIDRNGDDAMMQHCPYRTARRFGLPNATSRSMWRGVDGGPRNKC